MMTSMDLSQIKIYPNNKMRKAVRAVMMNQIIVTTLSWRYIEITLSLRKVRASRPLILIAE
jgi:hypothetical protein